MGRGNGSGGGGTGKGNGGYNSYWSGAAGGGYGGKTDVGRGNGAGGGKGQAQKGAAWSRAGTNPTGAGSSSSTSGTPCTGEQGVRSSNAYGGQQWTCRGTGSCGFRFNDNKDTHCHRCGAAWDYKQRKQQQQQQPLRGDVVSVVGGGGGSKNNPGKGKGAGQPWSQVPSRWGRGPDNPGSAAPWRRPAAPPWRPSGPEHFTMDMDEANEDTGAGAGAGPEALSERAEGLRNSIWHLERAAKDAPNDSTNKALDDLRGDLAKVDIEIKESIPPEKQLDRISGKVRRFRHRSKQLEEDISTREEWLSAETRSIEELKGKLAGIRESLEEAVVQQRDLMAKTSPAIPHGQAQIPGGMFNREAGAYGEGHQDESRSKLASFIGLAVSQEQYEQIEIVLGAAGNTGAKRARKGGSDCGSGAPKPAGEDTTPIVEGIVDGEDEDRWLPGDGLESRNGGKSRPSPYSSH